MRLSFEEVELLLEIVADPSHGNNFGERIEAAADSLGALIPCTSVSAFVLDPSLGGAANGHAFFKGHDPKSLLEYASDYMRIDPMGAEIGKATGVPVLLSDYISDSSFGRDAYTSDYLAKLGIRRIMGVTQPMPGGSRLALAVQRLRGQRDFTAKERELLRLVIPHVAHSAFVALFRARVASLAQTRDACWRCGGLIIERGRVVHIDQDARLLLQSLGNGRRDPESVLAELVQSVVPAQTKPGELFKRPTRLGCGAWVLAQFCAIGAEGPSDVLAILEMLPPTSDVAFHAVADEAKLTAREREFAALAIRGEGNRAIGSRLGAAEVTVGVVLTKVYRKLGVAGRTELAALFYGGGAAE